MISFRHVVLPLALAGVSLGIGAQTDTEHVQHHPADASSSAKTVKSAPVPGTGKQTLTDMDNQSKAMREMHEKMMKAKTPEERSALMADHMKAMQGGMAMMGAMGGAAGMKGSMSAADMSHRQQMLEKRMDMMTIMMRMMMDRLPAP